MSSLSDPDDGVKSEHPLSTVKTVETVKTEIPAEPPDPESLSRAVHDAARAAYAAGLCVIPASEDGLKSPIGPGAKWKRFQTVRPDRAQMKAWYGGRARSGLGILTGAISGGVEVEAGEVLGGTEGPDFDNAQTYKQFKAAAASCGLGKLVARIEAGYLERTPGGGAHWLWRCREISGNQKLAMRPDPTPEDPRHQKTLIELKGEGGFLILAPSGGPVHPSGRPYRLERGGFATIAVVSPEERAALIALARTFDERPRAVERAPASPAAGWTVRPGDAYAAATSWDEILKEAGWSKVYDRGSASYWRRPGKDKGISASLNHAGSDLFHCFTSSAPFPIDKSIGKFSFYIHQHHGGDVAAAVKALAALGYGEPAEPRPGRSAGTAGKSSSVGFVGNPGEKKPVFSTPPRPLAVDLLPVPAFPPELIPEPFRAWLEDIAERGCFPLEYPAGAALVALAAVVGRRLAIRPKRHDDWLVVPNLWGAVVGPPGIQKSPAIEEAMRPLKRLAAEAFERNRLQTETYEQQLMVIEAKADAARKALAKAAREHVSDEELARLAAEATPPTPGDAPKAKRYMINDTTVEKLGELLADNPHGLLLFRDELKGFFRSLDRQGHESDRGFYLEGWNGLGSEYVYDRIGRGTILIPNVCLSLFGTIQPGPLARYLRTAATGEDADGFMPRFQILLYPDPPREFVNVDRNPGSEARDRAHSVFLKLDRLDPTGRGVPLNEERKVPVIGFDSEAQEMFTEWRVDLENRLRSGSENILMQCHLAKYRSLMPSLALLFHLVESVEETPFPAVSLRATEAAAAWCDLLERHARRVYQSARDGDIDGAQHLAARLKQSLSDPFTFRQVAQKGWSGLATVEDVRRAVGILEDRGWVQVIETAPTPGASPGGRMSEKVWIHPDISGRMDGGDQP